MPVDWRFEFYDRTGRYESNPVQLRGRPELVQAVEETYNAAQGELLLGEGELYASVYVLCDPTGVEIMGSKARGISLNRLLDGRWVLDRGEWRDKKLKVVPVSDELAGQIMAYLQEETGWTWTYLRDIHDITKARMVIPDAITDQPVDITITGQKAKQLETLLSGAKCRGTSIAFVPGPQLFLTRSDGVVIPVALDAFSTDMIMLEPYLYYDFGPEDEQDRFGELLKLFGLKRLPQWKEGLEEAKFPLW